MRIAHLLAWALVLLFLSAKAQDKYGIVLLGGKILQANDTISLSYPAGSAVVVCGIFDANKNQTGKSPAQWSITGSLTIIDTPVIAAEVLLDASAALIDQKGYLIAQALDTSVQWINNRVFVKIKGKNSGVLQRKILLINKQTPSYDLFDCFGRIYNVKITDLHEVIIVRDLANKKSTLATGIYK